MSFLAHSCLGMLLCCLNACGSSGKNASKSEPSNHTQQHTETKRDTMPDVPIVAPAPAPGTVRVEAEVIAEHHNKAKSTIIYEFRIARILAVGSAAPAVITGDTLQVNLSSKAKQLHSNIIIKGTIRYLQHLKRSDDSTSTPTWELVNWKYKNYDN